ncbi:MAG: chemotaxis protein CheD [Oscillospiraceae bacterium]|nr:chemotaxis protein CheD [Oscillospiraceae bacterium]
MNISVGISDWKTCKPPDVLVTYALGSCVGICLWDKMNRVSGLSHVMLPDSSTVSKVGENRMKFADTAVPDMHKKMLQSGALQRNLVAKIAGGAVMFASASSQFNIGERNVEAVRKVLKFLQIPIIAHDTGKNYGRTVFFHPETGKMEIKSSAHGVTTL